MHGWCSGHGTALAGPFERRSFDAQAGLGVEANGGKLEIEPPMTKAKLLALCLAANGYLKWRACGAIFASSRGYPLFGMDQSPLARRAGPAGIFREKDEV